MVINPIVGVYIPIIRIPIKGGMTIPNIATFDHGTCHVDHEMHARSNIYLPSRSFFQRVFRPEKLPKPNRKPAGLPVPPWRSGVNYVKLQGCKVTIEICFQTLNHPIFDMSEFLVAFEKVWNLWNFMSNPNSHKIP